MGVRRAGGPRWGLAVVRGRSMEPTLSEGDRLLVDYRGTPKPGRLVLARFADGTLAVKRVADARRTRTGEQGWWLLSDNADEGVDSRHRGVVPAAAVLGVVRCGVWPCRIRHIRRAASSLPRSV